MKIDDVERRITSKPFPLKGIKEIIENAPRTKYVVVDSSSEGGLREVTDTDIKMKLSNVSTRTSKHSLDEKVKHECYETTYSTNIEGMPVDFSFKFCPACKRELDMKAAVFDWERRMCRVIKY